MKPGDIRVLCVVTDCTEQFTDNLESVKRLLPSYSNFYVFTQNSEFDSIKSLVETLDIPRGSFIFRLNEDSLKVLFYWSTACPVDLVILSRDEIFNKEIRDRYGFERKNIRVIN